MSVLPAFSCPRCWCRVPTAGGMSGDLDQGVLQRYAIRKRLGKGAYGIVWKAIDRTTEEVVAIKKIFDAFRNRTDAQRTFREVMFLKEFDHPNIVKLKNIIRADNDRDIYLIFEFMDTDLHAVIRKGRILKDIHKRYIMYQLLKATKYIHSGNVIHRDHKPSNVLLNSECVVKVCDFGLARSVGPLAMEGCAGSGVGGGGGGVRGDPALTECVATRWYRAPEILLSTPRYTKGVDMWNLGCILGEMLTGKPLFPGESTINQLECIMAVVPPPSRDELMAISSDYGRSMVERLMAHRKRRSLGELARGAPPEALDLLSRLLVFNPERRLTAAEALAHPYVCRFHDPPTEPSLNYDVVPPVDDNTQLAVNDYRSHLYELILERKGSIKQRRRGDARDGKDPLQSLCSDPIEVTCPSPTAGLHTESPHGSPAASSTKLLKAGGGGQGSPVTPHSDPSQKPLRHGPDALSCVQLNQQLPVTSDPSFRPPLTRSLEARGMSAFAPAVAKASSLSSTTEEDDEYLEELDDEEEDDDDDDDDDDEQEVVVVTREPSDAVRALSGRRGENRGASTALQARERSPTQHS
ncbi:extracellular signal-regulated kinase 2-like isoform X1 [Lampetra fluviatilis]